MGAAENVHHHPGRLRREDLAGSEVRQGMGDAGGLRAVHGILEVVLQQVLAQARRQSGAVPGRATSWRVGSMPFALNIIRTASGPPTVHSRRSLAVLSERDSARLINEDAGCWTEP